MTILIITRKAFPTSKNTFTRLDKYKHKYKYASFEYGLNRIQIGCNTKNISSANVAKRLNYHLDGEMRENGFLSDGTFRNDYIFSKLKSEWAKGKK